jgi:hypothetical protein
MVAGDGLKVALHLKLRYRPRSKKQFVVSHAFISKQTSYATSKAIDGADKNHWKRCGNDKASFHFD